MSNRHRFPKHPPEEFYGPEDHVEGMDVAEELADSEKRIAVWEEGYERLTKLQRVMVALGIPVRTNFEVRTTGPDPGVYDDPAA